MFRKTPKQVEANALLADYMYCLLFGGRRSGKTFIIVRNIFMRALNKHSRHIAVRRTFSSIKQSVWYETIPKVFKICFPQFIEGVHYRLNKSDFFIEFLKNGSTFWIGGLDDKERMEKILGREYSTAYMNEASNTTFDGYEIVMSGLSEDSGLPLKLWGDCNPPSEKHWIHKLFIEGINPDDNKPQSAKQFANYASLIMNPLDNKANLPPSYFDILDGLSKRKRDRFRDGLFSSDIQGALWSNEMINACQLAPGQDWLDESLQTIIALDPNVAADRKAGEEFTADEAGIIVISKDTKSRRKDGKAQVEADYSGEYSTTQWAKKAVESYHKWDADCLVYEKNQGGALVADAIRAVEGGEHILLKPVWASKGKYARAEPVTVLYEQSNIKHKPGLDKLETELLEYVPANSSGSPNRLDALVWGATYLFFDNKTQSDFIDGEVIC